MKDQQQLSGQSENFIIRSTLKGEKVGRINELIDFRKPSQPLRSHNAWEQEFVSLAGQSDVSRLATEIYQQIRENFKYKRKESTFTNEGPVASITTPDFDVHVSLGQHPEQADQYMLSVELTGFRRPAVLDDPSFLKVFSAHCDRVVFDLAKPIDLEEKIDEIEEVDTMAEAIDYDPACTWFTLQILGTGIILHATDNQIVFSLANRGDLQTLVTKTRAVLARLAVHKIGLGLPAE